MVLAAVDDETLVAGGEGEVDPAGLVGGQVERLAQAGVPGLGRPAVVVGDAGMVDLGDQAGEGPQTGQVGVAAQVTGPAQDPSGERDPDAGGGEHDAVRVGLLVEGLDAFFDGGDLGVEGLDDAHLGGDVVRQFGEVQAPGRPQGQGLLRGGEELIGLGFTPVPPGWS